MLQFHRAVAWFLVILWLFSTALSTRAQTAGAGDPLPHIDCRFGHTAVIYAAGLQGPDGLALNPADGQLYVAEEKAGQVTRINADGSTTAVLRELANPEGIAFDAAGNLYVVEDQRDSRLVRQTAAGVTTTLADDLDAPEGIAITSDGTAYVTESTAQFVENPLDFVSHITAVALTPPYTRTRLLTTTYTLTRTGTTTFTINAPGYAGITPGPDGRLYVTNEASRGERVTGGIAFRLASAESVYAFEPATAQLSPFSRDLVASEGLRFSPDGDFPLFVVEENVPGPEETGRLNLVAADGSHRPFCTGFGSIEDVALDADGTFYVSEDDSGFVIRIFPANVWARIGWAARQLFFRDLRASITKTLSIIICEFVNL